MLLLNSPVGLGRQPPVKKADGTDSIDGHLHIVLILLLCALGSGAVGLIEVAYKAVRHIYCARRQLRDCLSPN